MQPAGRIYQYDIRPVGNGRLERIESHGSGVRPHLLFYHRRPRPVGPYLKLVDGGCPERIRRTDINLLARTHELGCQLAYRSGLADTVHPYHHHDIGSTLLHVQSEAVAAAVTLLQQSTYLLAKNGLELSGIHIFVARHAGLDVADYLHGGIYPHIGGDEHLLQVVEHRLVHLRPAGHGTGELAENSLFGLFQPLV